MHCVYYITYLEHIRWVGTNVWGLFKLKGVRIRLSDGKSHCISTIDDSVPFRLRRQHDRFRVREGNGEVNGFYNHRIGVVKLGDEVCGFVKPNGC